MPTPVKLGGVSTAFSSVVAHLYLPSNDIFLDAAIQEKSALTEQRTMAEVERKLREDEDREIRKAEQRKREILKSFEFNSNIVGMYYTNIF